MSKVAIVGAGIVGHNLAKELSALEPVLIDKFKDGYPRADKSVYYDFAFICVDTPLIAEKSILDISSVIDALNENNAGIYIIKSTVPIGTTDELAKKLDKNIIFSPEYYGATQHCNNFLFNFTVLGGDKEICQKVQNLLQNCYDGRHVFRLTDAKVAETTKLMENSWIATKVTFCNEFGEFCRDNSISYEDVRECFVLDPRVNPSHTFVYEEHPYYQSHCLDKDVPQAQVSIKSDLLKQVIDCNFKRKIKHNCIDK